MMAVSPLAVAFLGGLAFAFAFDAIVKRRHWTDLLLLLTVFFVITAVCSFVIAWIKS
jgi:hypothetical protein